MKIKYHESGDLDLLLLLEEVFPEEQTRNFFDLHETSATNYIKFRGIDKEQGVIVFLGYSQESFEGAEELEGRLGRLLIPENVEEAWRINLSQIGVKKINSGEFSVRILGGAKLKIRRENAMG